MVIISVNPVYAQIHGLEDLHVIDAISADLSYVEPGYKYSLNYRYGKWDGTKRLLSSALKFPSGLVKRVSLILDSFKIEFEIRVDITYPESLAPIDWIGPDLYPYQNDVLDIIFSSKRGMVKVATGGGKSMLIAKTAAEYNLNTMIYVVSLDLLSQLRDTLESVLGIEVGIIGGGQCNIKKITVCSVWTAGLACNEKLSKSDTDEDVRIDSWTPAEEQREEIREKIQAAELVILDEAQFAAARSIQMILKHSKSAAYKYGFSGTPWRTSGDDILLEAAFGECICDISASALIDMGYLVPPKIAFREIPEYSKKIPKKWPAVKSTYIINNPERNSILVKNAIKLLEMGRKPLMLFRDISHGKALRDAFPEEINTKLVMGSVPQAERDSIRKEFKNGSIDLLIASTVYDQGVDIKELDALINCSGGRSTSKALQRIGRVIRGNDDGGKKDAYVVDTFDQVHFMREHSLIRYNIYKSEPKFILKVPEIMQKYINKKRG